MQILASRKSEMKRILRSKRGLSTVVTTLIILVVSVLLATVVTYYAINITSTRVEEESLSVRKAHVWVDTTGDDQAAFVIINTGGRDVVLDKITVRGQEISWSSVFYNISSSAPSDDLSHQDETNLVDNGTITIGTTSYTLEAASNDIVLPSGQSMIVYIKDPGSISRQDVGTTVGIVVFTAQAQYYKECNVEAYTG